MTTWREMKTPEKCYIAARAADGKTMTAEALAHEIGRLVDGPAPTRNAVIGLIRRHEPEGVTLTRSAKRRKERSMAQARLMQAPEVKPTPRPHPRNITKKREARQFDPGMKPTPQAFRPGRIPRTEVVIRSKEITLLDLEQGQCKFATNDAKPGELHLFCGHPQKDGSSYCPTHHRIAYTEYRRAG